MWRCSWAIFSHFFGVKDKHIKHVSEGKQTLSGVVKASGELVRIVVITVDERRDGNLHFTLPEEPTRVACDSWLKKWLCVCVCVAVFVRYCLQDTHTHIGGLIVKMCVFVLTGYNLVCLLHT